jgi:hypothetical protein
VPGHDQKNEFVTPALTTEKTRTTQAEGELSGIRNNSDKWQRGKKFSQQFFFSFFGDFPTLLYPDFLQAGSRKSSKQPVQKPTCGVSRPVCSVLLLK